MRLLHARSLKFQDFNESSLPPYAILSHTWDATQEVTLQDMASPYLPSKKGYTKITETCRLALGQGLEYVWIDTCCIDKSSSAELTESINSMFRWYQKARVCYVYLSDLHTTYAGSELAKCAWFTRGWTLQELLAPPTLEFYNSSWGIIGTRTQLQDVLAEITRIPVQAITGERSLGRFSTAQRMSWASKRVTTRVEDVAYCLLGLFGVQMPLIYGEGRKAFHRLQEEIIKRTFDLTLFAWLPGGSLGGYCSVLAPSPTEFDHCGDVVPFDAATSEYTNNFEYSITNMGVKMTALLIPQTTTSEDRNGPGGSRYILPLGFFQPAGDVPYIFGILIIKTGPRAFIRLACPHFARLTEVNGDWWARLGIGTTHAFHMLVHIDPEITARETNPRGMCIPEFDNIQMRGDYSLRYWDNLTRFHYFPRLPNHVTAFSFVAFAFDQALSFGVIFDFRGQEAIPKCLLIDKGASYSRLFFLVLMRNRSVPMSWSLIEQELPDILQLTNQLRMDSGGMSFKISACVVQSTRTYPREDIPQVDIPQLDISVSRLDISPTTVAHDPGGDD